jgi:hypothetical protein
MNAVDRQKVDVAFRRFQLHPELLLHRVQNPNGGRYVLREKTISQSINPVMPVYFTTGRPVESPDE